MKCNVFMKMLLVSTAASAQLVNFNGVYAKTQNNVVPEVSKADRNSAGNSTTGSGNSSNMPPKIAEESNATSLDAQAAQSSTPQTDSQTIIVTGSYIRGKIAAGATINIYSAEDLDKLGYATVQEFIQQLPQNFQGGGGSEDPTNGSLSRSNQMGGSSVNLRGLGADSTLILINGRRGALSGLQGNFRDISLIPQSAIQRVEILTDGASALYGSDAVGGVVNFLLKKEYNGAETRFRYGRTTSGQMDEYRLGHTMGSSWQSGHLIFSYEYYHRDRLSYGERDFASTLDMTSRGGADYRGFYSNPGNILDPVTGQPAYAIPRGQDGRSLQESELLAGTINLEDRAPKTTLLPKQDRHSAFLFAEQNVADWLSLFTEVLYSERKSNSVTNSFATTLLVPETNAFYLNPFGSGPVAIAFSLLPELGLSDMSSRIKNTTITGGATATLGDWRWETYAAYSLEKSRQKYSVLDFLQLDIALSDPDPQTALNVYGDGQVNNPETLSKIVGNATQRPRSELVNVNSVIDGPMATIDGVDLSIAVGADYRREKFRSPALYLGEDIFPERYSRYVYAIFGEIYFPWVEPGSDNRFIHSLDISVASRLDKYSDAGSTTNPKFGIRFSPVEQISFNATYGTSYRAPNLTEKSTSSNFNYVTSVIDPASPSGLSNALILTGNDPDLEPEKAKTWTVGATFLPAKNVRAEIIYFRTRFNNRIDRATRPDTLLTMEALYPDLVTRNPSTGVISIYCQPPIFLGNPSQCTESLVDVIIDSRLQNMASSKVSGIDGSITYSDSIGTLGISLSLAGTYLFDYSYQQTDSSPNFDTVGTVENPVDFRGRAIASVIYDGGNATIVANYTDSYKNNRSLFQRSISSYLTFDINMSINFDQKLNIYKEAPYTLLFSVTNLFNNNPPFVDNDIGYDSSNADPQGRLISVELRARW